MEFSEQLASDAAATAAIIDDILRTEQSSAQRLREAMLHAAMSGGKRLRAALVLGAARLSRKGSQQPGALRVAAALEMLHAYSLVHDDLPSMDNAATRRGNQAVIWHLMKRRPFWLGMRCRLWLLASLLTPARILIQPFRSG